VRKQGGSCFESPLLSVLEQTRRHYLAAPEVCLTLFRWCSRPSLQFLEF
jgi:hypothetical protein